MTTPSSTKQRTVSAGKLFFQPEGESGDRYLGLTPGFTINVAGEKIESYSAEDGVWELDDTTLTKTTRGGKLTSRQNSLENLAMFVIGGIEAVVQDSGAVTDEHKTVSPDRYYQLGVSSGNLTGVRSVSSVAVVGKTATDWATATAYAVGGRVKATSSPTHIFVATTAGASGGTEPTWPATIDATVTDGAVTWRCETLITLVKDTDYTIDADLARAYALPGARVSAFGGQWTFGYTKAAVTRNRVTTAELVETTGRLWFIADNAKGENRDIVGSNVTLTPNGDWAVKSDAPAYVEYSWDITFNKGNNGEPALIIDGRPV